MREKLNLYLIGSLCFLAVMLAGASCTADVGEPLPLPSGWRLPMKKETAGTWRDQDPLRFLTVEGDFDGDKKQDAMKLLVERKSRKLGLFVWWGKTKSRPSEVHKEERSDAISEMGVRLIRPGDQKSACGKGYFECRNSPEKLSLKFDAVEYFKTESASSVFHWDHKKRSFERVWISD